MCEELCVPKIVAWLLLEDLHVAGINEKVTRYIALGWEPVGDWQFRNGGYRQAVVKFARHRTAEEQLPDLHGLLLRWMRATDPPHPIGSVTSVLRLDTEAALRGEWPPS